jgi:hypothetical protein
MLVVPTVASGWVMLVASCGWGPGGRLEVFGPLGDVLVMVFVVIHRDLGYPVTVIAALMPAP